MFLRFSEGAGGPGASPGSPGSGEDFYVKNPARALWPPVHPVPSTNERWSPEAAAGKLGPGQAAEPGRREVGWPRSPDSAGHGVPRPPGSPRAHQLSQRRQQTPPPGESAPGWGGGGLLSQARDNLSLQCLRAKDNTDSPEPGTPWATTGPLTAQAGPQTRLGPAGKPANSQR